MARPKSQILPGGPSPQGDVASVQNNSYSGSTHGVVLGITGQALRRVLPGCQPDKIAAVGLTRRSRYPQIVCTWEPGLATVITAMLKHEIRVILVVEPSVLPFFPLQ